MLVVMFYDDTWYILNVLCQSTGYYLQTILQLGFHTGTRHSVQMSSKTHTPLGLTEEGRDVENVFHRSSFCVIDATNVDMNSIKWTEFIEL